MSGLSHLDTVKLLDKMFKYINTREKYPYSSSWMAHGEEVVAALKKIECSDVIMLDYLWALKLEVKFVVPEKADEAIKHYNALIAEIEDYNGV
jgi:hypothetical protein